MNHMFRFMVDPECVEPEDQAAARRIEKMYGNVEVIVEAETLEEAEREFLKLWYVDEEDEEQGGWLD